MSRDDADAQSMGFRSSDELRDFQQRHTFAPSPSVGADGLPELPKVGPIGYASVVDVQSYAPWLKIGPHLVGVRDVALWTTDQMRAYALSALASRPVGDGGAANMLRQARELAKQTLAQPGIPVPLPPLLATEGQKFMRGEPSLFDSLTLAQANEVAALIETAAPGWVCAKCGTDRTKAPCPRGHSAALTGDCPMVGAARTAGTDTAGGG